MLNLETKEILKRFERKIYDFSDIDILDLYAQSKDFRTIMDSGKYVYLRGKFVSKSSVYGLLQNESSNMLELKGEELSQNCLSLTFAVDERVIKWAQVATSEEIPPEEERTLRQSLPENLQYETVCAIFLYDLAVSLGMSREECEIIRAILQGRTTDSEEETEQQNATSPYPENVYPSIFGHGRLRCYYRRPASESTHYRRAFPKTPTSSPSHRKTPEIKEILDGTFEEPALAKFLQDLTEADLSSIIGNDIEPPSGFSEALRYFMNEKHLTVEELAYRTGLSEKTITRLRNGKNRPTIENVIAVIIGLQLGSMDGEKLLARAGYVLTSSELDRQYKLFINIACGVSIKDCNKMLIRFGYAPLTNLIEREPIKTVPVPPPNFV